jgi:hypothetical protein
MNNKIQNVDNVEVMRILEMHSKEGYKTPLLTEQPEVYSKWPSCVLSRTDLKKGTDPNAKGIVYTYDNGQGASWTLFLGSGISQPTISAGSNTKVKITANPVYIKNTAILNKKNEIYSRWGVWYCESNQIKIKDGNAPSYTLKALDKSGTSLVTGKVCLSNYNNNLVKMGNGRPAYEIFSNNIRYFIYGDDEAIYNDDGGKNKELPNFYCDTETKQFTSNNGIIPFNTKEGYKKPTESCIKGHPYITSVTNDEYTYTKGGFIYTLNRNNSNMKVVSGGGKSSDPKLNTWKCLNNQIEITLKKGKDKNGIPIVLGTFVLEGEATGKSTSPQPVKDNTSNTGGNKKQKSNISSGKKTENKPAPSAFVSTEVGP